MSEDMVTKGEFYATIKPIQDDVGEIKTDVKSLLSDRYQGAFLGGRGQAVLLAAIPVFLSAAIAVAVSLVVG